MNRLKARVNFKRGIGQLFDPETGKNYGNMVIDWRNPTPKTIALEIAFGPDEVEHVENPWIAP
jgi:hypothetical protein